MNYEQARQIGPDGVAPGKWNWSTRNDDQIWTSAPCDWPDYERPPIDPQTATYKDWSPTGRERCDHDSQEEAERHRYEYEIQTMTWQEVDQKSARMLHRCDFPECKAWAAFTSRQGGWPRGDWCWDHANADSYRTANPFAPGLAVVHS